MFDDDYEYDDAYDDALTGTLEQIEDYLSIEKWQYNVAISVGIIVALWISAYVSIVYVPSFIASVLKFRSGVLPSLRDKGFQEYRRSLDQVTSLFGSAFWGTFFASGFGGLIFAGLVRFTALMVAKGTARLVTLLSLRALT